MKEDEIRDLCIAKASDYLSMEIDSALDHGDVVIESPIERMLYSALVCVRTCQKLPNDDVDSTWPEFDIAHGLVIEPQREIGKYYVDFLVTYRFLLYSSRLKKTVVQLENSVIVECDGHDWHDFDEPTRRKEKQRDRFLQKEGYKIFHYTGKEITDDPIKVAEEIIEVVTSRL